MAINFEGISSNHENEPKCATYVFAKSLKKSLKSLKNHHKVLIRNISMQVEKIGIFSVFVTKRWNFLRGWSFITQ